MNSRKADQTGHPRSQNSRPTIGFLCDQLINEYSANVWDGVRDTAFEHGASLLCFSGGTLHGPREFGTQANVLYDLVDKENVDGLVLWGAQLAHFTTLEELKAFCERYRPLPIVNIGLGLEGIPSVLADNHQGMHDVVAHLIKVHGHRRIAYIGGLGDGLEVQERYRGYTDALAGHGIPLDPALVVTGSEMDEPYRKNVDSGEIGVRILLDTRKLQPQADFEALVGYDDGTGWLALNTLQARGFRVPADVAVASFDDIQLSQYLTPPLTTARQSFYDLGRRGAEMLLAQLRGEEVPKQVILPMEVIVRRSCGCSGPTVMQAAAGPAGGRTGRTASRKKAKAALAAQRDSIVAEMAQALGSPAGGVDIGWLEQLVDTFGQESVASAESKGESAGVFLATLDEVLRQVAATGGDVAAWQNAISALRRHALSYLSDAALPRAEDLWQLARVAIGEMAQRVQAYQAWQAAQQTQMLHEIGQAMVTTSGVEELMDLAARELPRLGIPSAYLALYEDPGAPADWSRLVLAYDADGRVALEVGGRRFPSRQLLPAGLLPQDSQHNMVVEPLYLREDQLGFAIFGVGPREGIVYETLRGQLSSALKGALLVQQMEHRALQLQTAAEVSRATSSILDPDELIQQVVNLARERFDLYYAGLFLVDEIGEWAVLRAGTGEAGRVMLEQGHRLEIGGASMIGWCVANKQARIALDVGAEAVRFENPHLPETRSEIALPLISRDEVLGALTIQSTQEAAFSQEDIAVLQTMADQLANAITNARLYGQAQQEIVERKRAEAALTQQAQELTASLEQFAHVASHDLQEPLRMVASYAQLLEQRYRGRLDAEADEFIGYAVGGATRMHRLINDLLAYWRVGTRDVALKPADCSAIVNRVLANLQGAIEATGATVTCSPLPTIMADVTQLMQVFQGLLINTIQFRSDRPPEIRISAERKDGEWLFAVHDNGIGIEPQYSERIFTLFQPLQRQEGHSGIGLAICKKIVERHEGRIWVESQPGKGASFYFTIPDERGL
jgi:DNA-binding LacI/PurR family transcriptional regulator/signal transduction histidine kinase